MKERLEVTGKATDPSDRINQILAAYALPAPVRWEPVGGRYPHVYQVAAGSVEPSHFLKCYAGDRVSPAEVLCEIDLVNRLHVASVRVALPVANQLADWVMPVGAQAHGACAVLFERAAGRIFKGNELSSRQCEALGNATAAMHVAMDMISTQYPRRHMNLAALADGPLREIGPLLNESEQAVLTATVNQLKDHLANLSDNTSTPAYGLCHGDLYAANAAFDEQGQPTLFDFQDFEYGWRAYELAQFLWRIGRSWSDPDQDYRKGRWEAFIAGYNSVRQLTGMELRAVPAFVPLRLIWFMAFRLRNEPQSIAADYVSQRMKFLEVWMRNFGLE